MSDTTQAPTRPDSVTNAEMALIGGDALRSREAALKAKQQAVEMDLPLDGITILGGKVYVNNKGLTIMLRRDERGPGSVAVEVVKDAWDDCILDTIRQRMGSTSKDAAARWADAGLMRAKCKARISFPDGSHYEAYGDASIITMGMPAMHNPDYANHMAETRSVNRAIRRATGVDTTAEEMTGGISRDAVAELELDLADASAEDADIDTARPSTRPAAPAAKTQPTKVENERQQALRLNARITALCTALDIAPPQSQADLAALGQSLGWHAPKEGAPSATWKEQLIVRLEGEQARRADERAHPTTPPVAEGEPWTEPDILNALAAANAEDTERIAIEIITAHGADTLDDAMATKLSACVDLAERAFKATSAGQVAQVEIDAKASTMLNVDQYEAVVALTRRVRSMHGWQGSNGANSRQPSTVGAGAR